MNFRLITLCVSSIVLLGACGSLGPVSSTAPIGSVSAEAAKKPAPRSNSARAGIGELARAALTPHPALSISQQDGVTFRPLKGSQHGLIFYPGGDVVPEAYAPLALAWEHAGYTVCIPQMPFKRAIFAPNRANDVIKRNPEVKNWVVGGHSLGGVTASIFAAQNAKRIAGLFLFAAVPGPLVNLSRDTLPVLTLYGTRDPRVTLAEVNAEAQRLSQRSRVTAIEGGNHRQFGDYDPDPKDGEASISRAQQHELIIKAMLEWLKEVWPER